MRAASKLHEVAHPHYNEPTSPTIPLQGSLEGKISRWFLPRKETRLMSEEATRTGGLWMPYPLLGILLTLVLVLGGGIIGLYSTVSTMNATMLMRDADHRQEMTEAKTKIDLLQMYINDDRKILAVLQDRAEKADNKGRRNN